MSAVQPGSIFPILKLFQNKRNIKHFLYVMLGLINCPYIDIKFKSQREDEVIIIDY